MGIGLWAFSGFVAAAVSRLLPIGRDERWIAEAALALVTALLLGLVATFYDFGGWNELDWRAGLFTGLGALAAIGIRRAVNAVV